MIRTTFQLEAADKKRGLTFGELRHVVQEAMRADMPDDARLTVYVGWSRQIEKLEVHT